MSFLILFWAALVTCFLGQMVAKGVFMYAKNMEKQSKKQKKLELNSVAYNAHFKLNLLSHLCFIVSCAIYNFYNFDLHFWLCYCSLSLIKLM